MFFPCFSCVTSLALMIAATFVHVFKSNARCPYFQQDREKHKDAWVGSPCLELVDSFETCQNAENADAFEVNYGCKNNPHQMGESGGNFVLRPVSTHINLLDLLRPFLSLRKQECPSHFSAG